MAASTDTPDANQVHVAVDSLALDSAAIDEEEVVEVGYRGAPRVAAASAPLDDEVVEVGSIARPSAVPPAAQQLPKTAAPAAGADSSPAEEDDPLAGVEPLSGTQKAVIGVVVVLLILGALYLLDYWGVVSTGFASFMDGLGSML